MIWGILRYCAYATDELRILAINQLDFFILSLVNTNGTDQALFIYFSSLIPECRIRAIIGNFSSRH